MDPQLSVDGEVIPSVCDSHFKFLGMPIKVPPNPLAVRNSLKSSTVSMLGAVDSAPVTCHQKLRLYKQGICPRPTWPFLIEEIPVSYIERELQPLVTGHLKKWCGLAHPANTSLLYLPTKRGGMGLPSLTGLYKKQKASCQAQFLSSRDLCVQNIAQHQHQKESRMLRQKFKPAQLARQVLDTNPGRNQKTLAKNVCAVVSEEEEQQLMEKLLNLPRQGEMVQHFEGNAASWWAKSIGQLPPEPFRFVLTATLDTLPSNSNLNLWGKRTSTICPLSRK